MAKQSAGWVVVAVREGRGRRKESASVLGLTVHPTREAAEAAVRDQRSSDAMFNDETPQLIVLELRED